MKHRSFERQVLVNAVTGEVALGSQITGKATYQELAREGIEMYPFLCSNPLETGS